jgi:hypothetical protein
MPKQAKAGFILAVEKLEQVAGDWDWMTTTTSPVAKLNKWLAENPNFRLVETPRIESRLLSRQIEHGKDVMTFSISVSYLYEDISERTYDSRHTGIFERATESRSAKEEWYENKEEKREEEIRAESSHDGEPSNCATDTNASSGAESGDTAITASRTDYTRTVESADGPAAAASAANAAASANYNAATGQAGRAKHKFASAADAISFLAEHGFTVPESAVRTIVGITNRDVGDKHNKRRVEKTD